MRVLKRFVDTLAGWKMTVVSGIFLAVSLLLSARSRCPGRLHWKIRSASMPSRTRSVCISTHLKGR